MSIVDNRKAWHDYFIEEKYEAGLVLQGWEAKAIRAGRVQLKEAYVVLKSEEVWLIGCHITPLTAASTHVHADP
ncbi:MAG: SsrA-binding protein, partial [Betaproteobacteria bacterium]|nr:SsrA-binding protein [Betaproteobacteria bacterium]